MIQAWILTLVFYSNGSVTTPAQYTFKTREQCMSAQQWHKKVYIDFRLRTSCYPSYVTSK